MDQTVMVQRVIEAGKDQPIGVIAIAIVTVLQVLPFATGNRIDVDVITAIDERTKFVESATKEAKAKLSSISSVLRDIDRHSDKTGTEHIDIDKAISRVIEANRSHTADIEDITKIVTDNQHLFDILKIRLEAIEARYPRSSPYPDTGYPYTRRPDKSLNGDRVSP